MILSLIFEACKQLGYITIPSNIRNLSDEESFHLSFIDNDEREGYNPVDEAQHYKKAQTDFGYSTRELAQQYGNSYKYYQYKLKLLTLPKEITNQLGNPGSQLTEKHCRHICKLINQKNLIKKSEKKTTFY